MGRQWIVQHQEKTFLWNFLTESNLNQAKMNRGSNLQIFRKKLDCTIFIITKAAWLMCSMLYALTFS